MKSKYNFVKTKSDKLNKFIVTITGDVNDGDYMTRKEEYGKEEFDEYVVDALIDLKFNYSGSHELYDYPNEYDLSIPSNEYCDGYAHTLKTLDVKYVDSVGEIWDVELISQEDISQE